jgi:hypothetical protein
MKSGKVASVHELKQEDIMKKIVINTSYGDRVHGGFSLSHRALLRLQELGQPEALNDESLVAHWPDAAGERDPSLNRCGRLIPRDDDRLVQVVEELGEAANGHGAALKVISIPDAVQWEIETVGTVEHISEVHRTWS